jgi:hypothetical protein
MNMTVNRIALRAQAAACAGIVLLSAGAALAAHKGQHKTQHRVILQTPDTLFKKADVEHMSYDTFLAEFKTKRDADHSEPGFDNAALYYAAIKQQYHDRQASAISPAVLANLKRVRTAVVGGDTAAFIGNWKMGPHDKPYRLLWTRYCTVREDAIGRMLPTLKSKTRTEKTQQALLAKIRAYDDRVKIKAKPFHTMANSLTGLSDATLVAIVAHEEHTFATAIKNRR